MLNETQFVEGFIFLKIIYVSSLVEKNRNSLEALYILLAKQDKRNDFTKIAELMLDFDLPVSEAIRLYETKTQLDKRSK
jgi:hypothetical protein